MKRVLGIAMVLGLMSALTIMAQDVKPGKGAVKGKSGKAQFKANLGKIEIVDLGKDVKLEMVLIPAGKFKMGSPASENGRLGKETQHEVTLSKPYYMGKYEVTQEQWFDIMEEFNVIGLKKGKKLPMTGVSWNDCQKFIKRLNARTDGGFRLPTEAEWEYACRAGTTTAYSFGDKITSKEANCMGGESTKGEPVAVGSYKPNAFGLYEMHGNVWEWCEDWYGDYPAGVVTDPKGPATGEKRVLRGGFFGLYELCHRSAYRYSELSSYQDEGAEKQCLGFRLARSTDIKTTIATTTLLAPFTEAKAKEVQKEVAKSLHKELEYIADLGKAVKLNMVLIPAGKFKMGSPVSEKGKGYDETQHDVTITKPYYMGKYEVTQEQWEAVMGNNPSSRTKGAKLPVTDVSWNDCQEFIKKFNAKTNGGFRLPTEAEWEYACRAGTTTAHSFGDEITLKDANYGYEIGKPVAVGSYKPNAFGLYDMHGNVREWCEDWHGPLRGDEATNPMGQATGVGRVLRGGAVYDNGTGKTRSSYRADSRPTGRSNDLGFRLAKDK